MESTNGGNGNNGGSNYSVKEMFTMLLERVDRIETKVDGIVSSKADKTEVSTLAMRLEMLEKNGSVVAVQDRVRVDAIEKRLNDPTSTNEGRQALEIYKQYQEDHRLLESIRTWLGLAKWLGAGGILFTVVAVLTAYMNSGGKFPSQ